MDSYYQSYQLKDILLQNLDYDVKSLILEETCLFVSCGHELSNTLKFQTRAVTAVLNARIIPGLASLAS